MLKDPVKWAAYDQLGSYQPGQDFRLPPDWGQAHGGPNFSFDDTNPFAVFPDSRQRAGRGGAQIFFPDHGVNREIPRRYPKGSLCKSRSAMN